ncbi:AAA family ATPase [Streptomyces sp. HNM0663]|uniref:AAA family ATPase n=1 Tax=Streptomyces chengmaiensis TaxID=3040919 RepID=A0ABT6HIC4_9ACTN|nr:AAA family ATPase [Streptomyces chengmaiensis]MDH2388045.1 AAA family ATPase [Streptomyces chengmaiensis]
MPEGVGRVKPTAGRATPVGRADLLDRLTGVLRRRGRALLTGAAGVGKTEVAQAAAARAGALGDTVLWLAPQPADRRIPGAAAAALVASVPSFALDGLPEPQRTAVSVLCREAEAPETGWDPIALRLGVAHILRTLAAHGPVLLVVDDVQLIDADSADLLRFALRLAPPELRVLTVETPAPYAPAPLAESATPLAPPVGGRRPDPPRTHGAEAAPGRGGAADGGGRPPGNASRQESPRRRAEEEDLPGTHVGRDVPHAPDGGGDGPAAGLSPLRTGDAAEPTEGPPPGPTPGGDRAYPAYGALPAGPHTTPAAVDSGGLPLWVPSEADVLLVPPLHADEIAELLVHHRLPSRMAGRIHRASGGNPRLALAVGRSLADATTPVHHAEALPLSGRARDLARRMLAAACPSVRASLLLAALALRPTASLIRRAGRPDAEAELAAAERAGLVTLAEDGTVAFTAGLLPSTLVHDTSWTARSEGHAALATVADDPVEAVRHRALAADAPDEQLAAEVAEAARTARRLGNSTLAAELALLAAVSTPGLPAGRRLTRLADAAQEAARAARADLALRAAGDLLARDAEPADRVRARLAVLDTAGQGLTDLDELYVHAMEDSEGDPGLRAAVLLRLAIKYVLADGDPVRSRSAAVESARLASSAGDRHTAAQALTQQARMDRVLGAPEAEETLTEARALEMADRPLGIRNTAQILTIRHALFDDRLDDARDRLHALLPLVERRGPVEDSIELFRTLAEVESRRGHCTAALSHAGRSLALTLEAGLSPGPAWFALAVAETAGGSFARAASYARRSAQASEEEGDHVFLSRSLYALGRVQLAVGDVAGALETLRRVQEGESAHGTADPSMLRWHEELAEALLANDALQEAEELLADVGPVAERLGRRTVLLGFDRVYALCLAAGGKPQEAAGMLAGTAEKFAAHGLPLEQGRCLIALARVERRRRRRSAAQQALQSAAGVFERAGAAPWLELAAEGPSRPSRAARAEAAASADGSALSLLTEAELRLAQLVGQGASNQEAAARLYLSVKTVEARLTRIYQKLDVRSRAQLATALSARPGGRAAPRATPVPG